ncbi:ATPase [Mycolicibacter heraklionensis]|nr:ATPase [Mycolicibacter heraklionensis]
MHWRASPFAKALATAAALALVLAVGASRWQLIAFAAPLLAVLCSLDSQRRVPGVRVQATPVEQRCFETESVEFAVGAVSDPEVTRVGLAVSAHPALTLDIADSPAAAGCRKAVTATAERWGRYPIRATVSVVGRGGLLVGTGTVDVAEVTVFPPAPPQSTPIPHSDLLDRVGTHLTRHPGRGVEYADIRAYVPGDPLRSVNWPVSARRGSLHVTQRLTDRGADVVVLIDSYPQPAGPATEATQRSVLGAAQVVQTALRNGDRSGVVILGGRHPRWVGAEIGQRQFYRIVDAVLGAGDGVESTTGTLAPRAAVPAGALVIAFSTLLDTEFALALTDLRKRGHVVLAVDVLGDSPLGDDLDPLVARIWALQRSAMYRDMATIGVDVASWPHQQPLDQAMRVATQGRRPAAVR